MPRLPVLTAVPAPAWQAAGRRLALLVAVAAVHAALAAWAWGGGALRRPAPPQPPSPPAGVLYLLNSRAGHATAAATALAPAPRSPASPPPSGGPPHAAQSPAPVPWTPPHQPGAATLGAVATSPPSHPTAQPTSSPPLADASSPAGRLADIATASTTGPAPSLAPAPPPASAAAPLWRQAIPWPGNPLPSYPAAAREDGHEGVVVLRVQIDAQGRALAVDWLQRSGQPLLDHSARDTVRRWRFEPARHGDTAVPSQLRITLRYQLDAAPLIRTEPVGGQA